MSSNELALVNKVELRIALAGDSEKFENSLSLYLAPLILKLSSPHAEVRKVVFKSLQNIIPRVTAFRDIKLPVTALLSQVKDPKIPEGGDSSSVRLYSLLFISKGIDRLDDSEKLGFVPKVVEGIASYPRPVAARIFSIFYRLLENWKCTDRDSSTTLEIKNAMNDEDRRLILQLIGKFFLLQPTSSATISACPGISQSDITFFTKDAAIVYDNSQAITKIKSRLVEFLKVGFDDSQLAVPLLIASTDGSSLINTPAEFAFRKLHYDVDDTEFVKSIILLFTGSSDTPPVSPILQERILNILSRSKIALRDPHTLELAQVGLQSTYSKLKTTSMNYIKTFSSISGSSNGDNVDSALNNFNDSIAIRLKDMINVFQGSEGSLSSQSRNERGLIFESLGTILKSCPALLLKDLSYLEVFFQSLYNGSDSHTIIQDALSGFTSCLSSLDTIGKNELKKMCRRYIDVDPSSHNAGSASCQYIALKFINYAFPFDDSEARLLCVLGSSELNRPEAIEEAKKGLHPYWFSLSREVDNGQEDLSEFKFPRFEEMVDLLKSESENETSIRYSLGKGLEFTLQTLVMQSIRSQKSSISVDEMWQMKIEKALEYDKTVKDMLVDEINTITTPDESKVADPKLSDPYYSFIHITMDALVNQHSDHHSFHIKSPIYGTILSHLIPVTPHSVIMKCNEFVKAIMKLMKSANLNYTTVKQMGQIVGVIGSDPFFQDSKVDEIIQKLMGDEKVEVQKEYNILFLGYLFSRLILRGRLNFVNSSKFQQYLKRITKHLEDGKTSEIMMDTLYNLSIFGVLGPQLNKNSQPHMSTIISIISKKAKKQDERAILTLSALMLTSHYSEDCSFEDAINVVYESHNSKQVEKAFTGGEAFSIMAFGWSGKFLEPNIDILGCDIRYIPEGNGNAEKIIDLILKSCDSTKPSLRRFSCIWLLSLVQYCGNLKELKSKAQIIHLTFMKFLVDRDELVQESASKGLGLVYEMGNNDLKETLVKSLLKSFTDSNTSNALSAGSIGLETELFEADVLKTDDGTISTYKDVLNLASEVGDPSLVYKFMSLAKSSAIWTSRKGLAFGLGSILSNSSLDSLLKADPNLNTRLIPKLFRYRYDPNSSVAASMNDIWNVLVKDSSGTIKQNSSLILKELLSGMGNREWRIRQASTSALKDLLQYIPRDLYDLKSQEIWNMSFRVMDDVKGSVRKEGNDLTSTLASKLVNRLDKEGETANSTSFLHSIIPFLMGNKGLLSDSEEVKNFALKTVLDLCKVGGKAVKPYVPELIEQLISLMSTLEPEFINYLALNADKYNIESSDLDVKRLQSLTTSPLMDAIDKLLDQLDEEMMQNFIFKLKSSVKSSVGLPSKVCGSRVIVILITRYRILVKPYGNVLLNVSISQINDKNLTVASTFAAAAGYCCRIASIKNVVEFSEKLNKLYFESEDDSERRLVATACESICKYSGEKFEAVAAAFLPLTFIGKHDIDAAAKTVFDRVWVDNTGGNSSSIKLYYTEVVNFFEKHMDSRRYYVRQILAQSILDLSNSIDMLADEKVYHLIGILVEASKGRSWEGKEYILESLVTVCGKYKDVWPQNDRFKDISSIVITEAKRKNRSYQKHAVKLLGKFLKQFPSDDVLSTYMKIIDTIIFVTPSEDDSDVEEMEVDSDTRMTKMKNIAREEESLNLLTNVCDSFPLNDPAYCELYTEFCLKKFDFMLSSTKFDITWRTSLRCSELMTSLLTEFDKLEVRVSSSRIDQANKIWKELNDLSFSQGSVENVKVHFIRLTKTLIKYVKSMGISDDQYFSCLQSIAKTETSSILQKELSIH